MCGSRSACSIHFFSIHFTNHLLLSRGSPVCLWRAAWKPRDWTSSWEPFWVLSPSDCGQLPSAGRCLRPGDCSSLWARHGWALGAEQSPAALTLPAAARKPARRHSQELSDVQLDPAKCCLAWISDCSLSEKDDRNKKRHLPLYRLVFGSSSRSYLYCIFYPYHTIPVWSPFGSQWFRFPSPVDWQTQLAPSRSVWIPSTFHSS